MKKRKSNSNYLKLGAFLLITIILLIYALKWHDVFQENKLNKIYITDYISEISMAEFNNYIADKRDIVIYFGVANDPKCRHFERILKSVITKKQLGDEIVYLNVSELKAENFKRQLDLLYNDVELRKQNKFLNEVPAFGVYENAMLVDFLIGTDLTKENVIKFLKDYEIIEEVE